jgi:hypothetical protein
MRISRGAVEGNVAASTQNVALCALLFLYRDVLQVKQNAGGVLSQSERDQLCVLPQKE